MFRTWISMGGNYFFFLLSFFIADKALVTYILLNTEERSPLSPSQSEREGERIDLPLAGLEKVKGSLSFSLLSCLCLCLCLCLCFFFFFLCSWWWWWWWSLCLEDVDSLVNTESGAAATGCILISKGDCSLPSRLKTPKWIPVNNKESEMKVRGSWWQYRKDNGFPSVYITSMKKIRNGRSIQVRQPISYTKVSFQHCDQEVSISIPCSLYRLWYIPVCYPTIF